MTSSVESLKRDIMRSIKSMSIGPSSSSQLRSAHGTPTLAAQPAETPRVNPVVMDPTDLDYMKDDIIVSLRTEVRDIVRDLMVSAQTVNYNAAIAPLPVYSELYQTHLYTQL